MRHMKKFASLMLALVMALALAVPAMAASGTSETLKGTITIDNAVAEEEYSIYRIFVLESYSGVETGTKPGVGTDITSGIFSFRVEEQWKPFFVANPGYVTLDDDGYVTAADGLTEANAADFAKAALAWAKQNNITPDATQKDATETPNEDGTVTLKFSDLTLGYYLVDSTLGTLCSLNTTAPDAVIKEKNEQPTNTKEVEEDSTGNWGSKNDADIGQTVNFRSTIIAKEGAENYVFHDEMSEGLTFDNTSVKVTLNGEPLTAGYTLVLNPEDECTFEVVFSKEFCDNLKDDDVIVISYSAVLNENAVIADTGNPNTSKLSYGEKNRKETKPSETRTYTYEFDLVKINSENELLDNAEFELYTKPDAPRTPLSFLYDADTNTYKQVAAGTENATTTIVVHNGKVNIEGLDADVATTYYLHETKAPAGYNKLTEDIVIHLTATVNGENNVGSATLAYDKVEGSSVDAELDEDGNYDKGGVSVVNNTGVELPSTGGIGTTIFYVVGGMLAAGAVILLITKRRMNIEK